MGTAQDRRPSASDSVLGRSTLRDGIRIGKLFGVEVIVDYSWIFIFLLMSWNLTAAFRHWHPAWSAAGSLTLGVVGALSFFTSVLIHEFGHALVARSFGMTVREIRLFLFGGVSNIEREPPSAKAEFWMAIVGPLLSVGIGVELLFVASWFLHGSDRTHAWDAFVALGPLPTLLLWLGAVNVSVGAFNLIPGFPLDGGRILRAALWAAEKDLHRATRQASTIGVTIGWLFIVAGISMTFGARIPFFGQGLMSGLWLIFIGWFLGAASRASYQGLLVQDLLAGVSVASLMRRDGYPIPRNATVDVAVHDWFMRSPESAFPVVDGDHFLGLVTADGVRHLPVSSWETTFVTEIMRPSGQVPTAAPTDDVSSAAQKLSRLHVGELPVVDAGRLVGVLLQSDLARWLELRLASSNVGAPRVA